MISSVSTSAMSNALSNSIVDLQKRLSIAQKELTTGQHADMSVALGSQQTRDSILHLSVSDIEAIAASNSVVSSRLEITQTSLQKLSTDAQAMRSALMTAQNGVGNRGAIIQQAQTALGAMMSSLNASSGGVFVFGGVKGDTPPIADTASAPPSAAKAALDAAFTSNFGFPPSDPAVSTITASQMNAFISGPMAALFSSNWTTDWSSASSSPLQNRISITQTSVTSVTANEASFQKLAAGYTMLTNLGASNLSKDTFQAVLTAATNYFDQGVSGLTNLQEKVGVIQSDVKSAQENMATQKDLLSAQIGALEGVDPSLASVTVTNLMTQIETSYSLTARIQQLSLTKYL
ncbi:flagellar hook-associated family protein [Methylocystis iwaonis]|uniref:flagellar hook-associated family protein n=1 Tax=Methylocystis iwaonis TaxID=2885079 RepID=UPI002E7AB90C|nr:flagellar hook-associated family protein [Methylocystis iwaonis]